MCTLKTSLKTNGQTFDFVSGCIAWRIPLPSDSQKKFWPEMLNNIKDEMQKTDIKDTDGTDI